MKLILILPVILAAVGCDRSDSKPVTNPPTEMPKAADNTQVNERDRTGKTLTAGDQSENETDRTITQRIRQNVVANDKLSMTAKNVKIITINSVVTLRGPVKSDQEKAEVASLAQHAEGVKRVDNQLEVASN